MDERSSEALRKMHDNLLSDSDRRPVDDSRDSTRDFTYDADDGVSVCVSIVRAVATVAGVDPTSIEPRLYDVVEPDALEKLVGREANDDVAVNVSFDIAGYEVSVGEDARIRVRESSDPTSAGV